MLHENFEFLVEENGPPQDCEHLPVEQLERLQAKLPDSLLQFIETHGVGQYFSRRFQMCLPETFSFLPGLLFGGDREINPSKCHVVGYSAFSELQIWSEEHYTFRVDLNEMRLFSSQLAPSIYPPDHPISRMRGIQGDIVADPNGLASGLIPREKDTLEEFDVTGKPLFSRAKNALGALSPGQVYGFHPMLALMDFSPALKKLENLKIVDAKAHFAILAQAAPLKLVRYENGNPFSFVRTIGTQK